MFINNELGFGFLSLKDFMLIFVGHLQYKIIFCHFDVNRNYINCLSYVISCNVEITKKILFSTKLRVRNTKIIQEKTLFFNIGLL